MTDVLLADDPLYEALYDIRREAEQIGNFVEEDVNPGMNALRARAPVHKGFLRELLGLPAHQRHTGSDTRDGYTSFSWTACDAAFRDHERLGQGVYTLGQGPEVKEQRLGILQMDEPEHRAYRATIQPMFLKPRTLGWWRDRWINDIVGALIDRLKRQGRAELNLDFCARIPVHTITRAVGMEGDRSLEFRVALQKSGGHGGISPDERRAAGQTVERMLLELIAERRREPKDDIISGLMKTELAVPGGTPRPLTDREIMIFCQLVMLAGGGTSWRQCGITLAALLTHPDQLDAVRSDRGLVERAIDEGVRWNPTDPVFSRLANQDVELEGVMIPKGSVLEICLAAANRDPTRWDRPDVYDLHRPVKNHLGFGVGTHQCLGMNVGKSEIGAGLNALLDAFPNLRLDPNAPAPFLTGGLEQRGMSSIHVLLN